MADEEKRDVVLENIGCGFYQVVMFLICSCCVMAEAVAVGSFTFGIPIAVCDMQINTSYIPWSKGLLSFGAAAGGILLGALSDGHGRSLVLPISLLAASAGLLVAAFTTSGSGILLAAMVLGFGLGAVGPAVRIYMAEIVTAGGRGCVLSLLDACWVAAYFACLLVWWAVSPVGGAVPQRLQPGVVRLGSWRVGLVAACCCCLLAACLTAVLRNTPRHLLCRGHTGEAHAALRHIFAMNKNQPENNYQAGPGLFEAVQLRPSEPDEEELSWFQHWCFSQRLRIVLSNRTTCRGTIAAAVATAALSPGWSLLMVWSSRLTADVEGPPWWVWAGCALDLSPADRALHGPLARACVAALLSLLATAGTVDCIGRSASAVGSLAIGGAVCMSLVASGGPAWLQLLLRVMAKVLVSQVAQATALLHVASVEMYPTHSRATMAGLVAFPRRLITAILLVVPAVPNTVICYAHGGAMLLGAIAALFLPELKRQPLVE